MKCKNSVTAIARTFYYGATGGHLFVRARSLRSFQKNGKSYIVNGNGGIIEHVASAEK
jgi:hypothetical protein